jgi:hypothetical protein
VGIYILHQQARGWRKGALSALFVLALISFVVVLPLFRYTIEDPEMVSYRTLTRMGTLERPLAESPVRIFFDNFWKASVMFFWDNGEIWPHSVPHRPALDVVSAALLFLGSVFLLVRYIRHRNWLDISLLISIPLLMLPSTLSLAFPAENPSLNRTGAAIIPVFIIIGLALDQIYLALSGMGNDINQLDRKNLVVEGLNISHKKFPVVASFIFTVLILWSISQNYDLVFKKYQEIYRESSWNTSELGHVVRGFADSIGNENQAWVMAYPYWVDTRLVGFNAGFPTHDYGIWTDQLNSTLNFPAPKLFLIKSDDKQGLKALQTMYPEGVLQYYKSKVETKDFLIYLVDKK